MSQSYSSSRRLRWFWVVTESQSDLAWRLHYITTAHNVASCYVTDFPSFSFIYWIVVPLSCVYLFVLKKESHLADVIELKMSKDEQVLCTAVFFCLCLNAILFSFFRRKYSLSFFCVTHCHIFTLSGYNVIQLTIKMLFRFINKCLLFNFVDENFLYFDNYLKTLKSIII